MQRVLSLVCAGALVLAAAACSAGLRAPTGGPGAPAAASAVERFLQLGGEREYLQMGWYFGTTEGPILQRDDPSDVEKRMYALATVLRHDAFVVGQGRDVPGRVGAAQGFTVRLQRDGRQLQVPFVTVQGPGGRWLVESIDVQAITNAP